MSTYQKQYKRNKHGYIVVADGRSNVSNPTGRPATKREQYLRVIKKEFGDNVFTSQDLSKFSPELVGKYANAYSDGIYVSKQQIQTRIGMNLRNLEKNGYIQCVGLLDNNKRGGSLKMYKLIS